MDAQDMHNTPDNEPTRLSFAKATRLMAQGLSDAGASPQSVVERVGRSDGCAWLERVYMKALAGAGQPPAASLEDLLALKERCKRAAQESGGDPETPLAANAVYLYCIASAIVQHGRLISARPREQVDDALVDMASVAPEPWRRLFMDAAMTNATRV